MGQLASPGLVPPSCLSLSMCRPWAFQVLQPLGLAGALAEELPMRPTPAQLLPAASWVNLASCAACSCQSCCELDAPAGITWASL